MDGSLRLTGIWQVGVGPTSLLTNATAWTISFFVRYNNATSQNTILQIGSDYVIQLGSATRAYYTMVGTSGTDFNPNNETFQHAFSDGLVYHVALTYAYPGNWYIYVNGVEEASGTTVANLWTTANDIIVGSYTSGSVSDFQIAKLGIWNNYQATAADVVNLQESIYTGLTLIGSVSGILQQAASYWSLADQTSGTPEGGDTGFNDKIGSNNYGGVSGTTNAQYSAPLVYAPPCLPALYVAKNGRTVKAFTQSNTTFSNGISGTVTVAEGSTSLTSSAAQAAWMGQQLQIAGDSSATTYDIDWGWATNWTIDPPYAGTGGASGATATLVTAFPLSVTTAVSSNPTFSVQWGGTGGTDVVTSEGPYWCDGSGGLPYVTYDLPCGPVIQAIVQTPGANYSTSPTASASGVGGGTAPTLGTPVVSGGITSFTGVSGTYSSPPGVIIGPPPAIPITGTFTTDSVNVTGITSTTGLYPGMTVFGSGPAPNVIATIVSGTAITLSQPATVSGSNTIDVYGKQAMATPVMSGTSLVGLAVYVPGTGYTLGSPPLVSFSSGDGAATAVVSRVIAFVPVTAQGSNNTGPPPITISDADGSGAVVVSLMDGVAPEDVVTYSAASGWISCAAGDAPATPSLYTTSAVANYSGQLEPGLGGYPGFNLGDGRRQMKMSYNVPGSDAGAYYSSFYPFVNWFKRASEVNNVVSAGYDQRPLTINGTAGSPTNWSISNTELTRVDGNSFPSPVEVWTLTLDETNPSNPLLWSLTSAGFDATIGTAVFTEGSSVGGVNAITLTAGGSGFTDVPSVVIAGTGTGATAYAIICNGVVIAVYLTSCGTGYTGAVTVTISGGGGSSATATATSGTILSGRTWQWTVTRNSTQDNLGLQLNCWRTVGGSYPYTAVNEYLFDPSQTAAALPGLPTRTETLNAATTADLTTTSGYTAWAPRWMDGLLGVQGLGNAVEAEDLVDQNNWAWTNNSYPSAAPAARPTATRTLNVVGIRTYAPVNSGFPGGWGVSWSSPKVFTNQWGTATPSWAGYGSGSLGGPFYLSPTSPGFLSTTVPTATNVAEFTTDIPHDLKVGQQAVIGSGTGTFTLSNGPSATISNVPLPGGATIVVYPTGPTTFCCLMFTNTLSGSTGAGLPGGINNVVGSSTISYTFSVEVPQGGGASNQYPVEVVAKAVGSLTGANLWLNISQIMTDAGVTSYINRVLANFPSGRKIYLEIGNEIWNNAYGFFYSLGQLGAWSGTSPLACYVERMSQIQAVCLTAATALGRQDELVFLMGTQGGYAGPTVEEIAWANNQSIRVHAVNAANYIGVPDDTSIQNAAYSLATHWPSSPKYQYAYPWKRSQYLDWVRHYVMYNISNQQTAGSAGMLSLQSAINAYTAGPIPLLVGYEGSLQQIVPGVIEPPSAGGEGPVADPQGGQLYYQITHDLIYDPAIYDVEDAYYWICQYWGYQFLNVESLGGDFADYIWPHVSWTGQPTGKGDGSTASNGLPITNVFWADTQAAHHDINASVLNAAWQRAANIANAPNVAPTTATLSGPTTSTESYPSTNFTITLDEPAQSGGVSCAITDSVGGDTVTTSPIVIAESATTGTFTVTASTTGARTVTLASTTPTLTIAGSPITLTAASSAPTSATLSGPTTSVEGMASTNFTITLNLPAQSGGVSCVVTSSVGGDTVTTSPVLISSGNSTGTFTVTASTLGARTITLTGTTPSLTISGSPITLTASSTPPTVAALTGPSTSTQGSASTNFTVTLNEPAQSGGVSCVITSTNGSDTITSTPLVISQGSSTGTFTVTASSVGSRLIAIASTTPSLTISGSPRVLTAGYPAPTRAALYGPTKSTVDIASMSFTVTLNEPAQSGGVSCVITDSVGGDTITTTPVVIAQNATIGTFTITASATGPRTITLASTTPSLTISGSPITMVGYNRNNRRFFGGLFRQRPGISS